VPPDPGEKVMNWRGVFVMYGLCGLAVAGLFWLVVRDRPPNPLGTPVADAPGSPNPSKPERTMLQRIGLLARTRNMWFFGGVQFGVNVGWVFIITLLPTYLKDVFDTPVETIGPMQTTALTIGILGMAFGGVFTDWLRAKLGPKHGRSVPIAITLSICAVVFWVVPTLPTAWAVVIALGTMAFMVDMHNPSIWSFAQDVGGKNVGAALGWGNMWGNLGAAISPRLLMEIRYEAGWNTAFICCGIAFACAAGCGLMLDATKPVDGPTSPAT
jgi:ACS family glucarate transporter-like MFS transporter